MSRFYLLRSVVECGKIRHDRVNFKQLSTKIITGTPHDSYHPKTQNWHWHRQCGLYVSQDHIDGELNIDGDDDVDISELPDLF